MTALVIYALLAAALVLANRRYGFDRSVGETDPTWRDKATYPKAYVHGVSAFAGTVLMLMTGVEWWGAFLVMTAGILAWEWSQRFFNTWDVAAGLAGLALALVLWIAFAEQVLVQCSGPMAPPFGP